MADIGSDKLRKKIKEILKNADLTTLSAKKVRMKLQSSFSTDLTDRKKEIDKMTMSLILEMEERKKKEEEEKEKEAEEQEEEEEEEETKEAKNGKKNKSDDEGSEEEEEEAKEEEEEEEPPKKKSKSSKEKSSTKSSSKSKSKKQKLKELDEMAPLDNDVVQIYDEEQKTLKMSDEELAQRLQSFDTGRRTRNRAPPKKKPGEKKERKGTSAYSKPCSLSADLAELMGTDKMARNEVVKKMWEIVRERKLEDPNDRRFMLCDEQLQKIFGRKRVQTFGMMKYLSSHIRDESQSLETVITNTDIYDDEADDD